MEPVPPHLTALLETDLNTYEKLELLRMLRALGGPVTQAELLKRLHTQDDVLTHAVQELTAAGFLLAGDPVRLALRGSDPEVLSLMQFYDNDRPAVLAVLSHLAVRRIRERAARTFIERRKPRDDET